MDRNQADLAFIEIIETWLREELDGDAGHLLAEMVLEDPAETVGLIRKILTHLRSRRVLTVDAPTAATPLVGAFRTAVDELADFLRGTPAEEADTVVIAQQFSEAADAVASAPSPESASGLVRLLLTRPHPDLFTTTGSFKKYQKKGKWGDAAKRAGLAKADGDRLCAAAEARYTACCNSWSALSQAIAARVLADVVQLVQPVIERFRDYKRSAALLDFDDLIFAARDLLRDHDAVRAALASRFAHVPVGLTATRHPWSRIATSILPPRMALPHEQFPPHRPADRLPDAAVGGRVAAGTAIWPALWLKWSTGWT